MDEVRVKVAITWVYDAFEKVKMALAFICVMYLYWLSVFQWYDGNWFASNQTRFLEWSKGKKMATVWVCDALY
jgi:hypothetical protein